MGGGLGLAPGANINYETGVALFEPTHGTAPSYANQDKVNPTSSILSGVLLLRHIGWKEAADTVEKAIARTVSQRRVTYDLARQLEGVQPVGTSKFADAVIENMQVI
jgi:isocitrate dehydrogenase